MCRNVTPTRHEGKLDNNTEDDVDGDSDNNAVGVPLRQSSLLASTVESDQDMTESDIQLASSSKSVSTAPENRFVSGLLERMFVFRFTLFVLFFFFFSVARTESRSSRRRKTSLPKSRRIHTPKSNCQVIWSRCCSSRCVDQSSRTTRGDRADRPRR